MSKATELKRVLIALRHVHGNEGYEAVINELRHQRDLRRAAEDRRYSRITVVRKNIPPDVPPAASET